MEIYEQIKEYSKNSAVCTLRSLMAHFDNEKVNINTIEVVETYISMANSKDICYFVKTFNEIIKKTSEQFTPMPMKLRGVYSEFFSNKLRKLYDKRMKNMTNPDFKSYCDNLFSAFLKSKVLKDFSKTPEVTEIVKQPIPFTNTSVNMNTELTPVVNHPKIVDKPEPNIKKEQTKRKNNIQLNEW